MPVPGQVLVLAQNRQTSQRLALAQELPRRRIVLAESWELQLLMVLPHRKDRNRQGKQELLLWANRKDRVQGEVLRQPYFRRDHLLTLAQHSSWGYRTSVPFFFWGG
jgi:hypothetical protein